MRVREMIDALNLMVAQGQLADDTEMLVYVSFEDPVPIELISIAGRNNVAYLVTK